MILNHFIHNKQTLMIDRIKPASVNSLNEFESIENEITSGDPTMKNDCTIHRV